MSAWDDTHAEAIEDLKRPDGCDCGIEFIDSGVAYPRLLRVFIHHNLDCPGAMPKAAAQFKRLEVDS